MSHTSDTVLTELARILMRYGWKVEPPAPTGTRPEGALCRSARSNDSACFLPLSVRAHNYLSRYYHFRYQDSGPWNRRDNRYFRGEVSTAELAADFLADPSVFLKPGVFGANSMEALERALRRAGYLDDRPGAPLLNGLPHGLE